MSFFTIPFPMIDPVAISLGPVSVKWYGLAYMTGLLFGWIYLKRLIGNSRLWATGKPPLTAEQVDDLLLWLTIGVVVGGRLGNVLFYDPFYYWNNPMDIPAIWKGGMAFHGAVVGCGIAIWLFARRIGANALSIMDICAAATPVGLLLGRVANFINAELWGRVTDVPWAMVFPGAGPAPRHPSQLYEAFFEGLVLFVILRILTHHRLALQTPGIVIGVFLIGYGLARSFCELFRVPDPGFPWASDYLTSGTAYSIPMILLGLYFIHAGRAQQRA